jgi:hypothetical protein
MHNETEDELTALTLQSALIGHVERTGEGRYSYQQPTFQLSYDCIESLLSGRVFSIRTCQMTSTGRNFVAPML